MTTVVLNVKIDAELKEKLRHYAEVNNENLGTATEKLLQLGVDDLITDKPEIIAPLLARDKALDNRLLWLRDQIQELLAAPDAEETMEVEETIEDAIEDPEEVLDEA